MTDQPEQERSRDVPPLEADDLVGWETVRDAIAGQPEATPSPAVERALLAKIRVREVEQLAPPPSWWTWAWGVAVAMLVTAILWAALKPGIVLEWAAQSEEPVAFRLRRGLAGGDELRELHAFAPAANQQQYRYVDVYVWPGHTYVYQVEVREGGRLVDQRTLVVPGRVALPGQLAVLVTGVLVGYGAVMLMRRRAVAP